MTYHSPALKRRRTLQALGGSALLGGLAQRLPNAWQRPLVRTAALPAHAQSSSAAPLTARAMQLQAAYLARINQRTAFLHPYVFLINDLQARANGVPGNGIDLIDNSPSFSDDYRNAFYADVVNALTQGFWTRAQYDAALTEAGDIRQLLRDLHHQVSTAPPAASRPT